MKRNQLTRFFTVLVFTMTSTMALAVAEQDVLRRFTPELTQYVLTNYQSKKFTGVDKAQINYYFLNKPNPDGVIIFSPGQSEASLKYSEVLYDFKDLNYDIYIIDHRGQGFSDRLLPNLLPNFSKSHVEHFSDYVDDFTFFVNTVIQPRTYKRSFLLSASMGGAIVAGYLSRYPKDITAAIFISPMFQINTGFFGTLTAEALAHLLDFTGFSNNYAPSQTPYNPHRPYENNRVTSSRPRFLMRQNLYNQTPQLQVGGTTVHWLKESLDFTLNLRTSENLLQIPSLVFQAGLDQFVLPYGQNRICEDLNPNYCRVLRLGFEKSQHEILMETDPIRNKAMAGIRAYIHYFETH